MKHNIKIKELIAYKDDYSVLYASSKGRGDDKELRCLLRGGYIVLNHGSEILETNDPKEAIDKYNKL